MNENNGPIDADTLGYLKKRVRLVESLAAVALKRQKRQAGAHASTAQRIFEGDDTALNVAGDGKGSSDEPETQGRDAASSGVWRSRICEALELPENVEDEILEFRLQGLSELAGRFPAPSPSPVEEPPHMKLLYKVHCSLTGSTVFENSPYIQHSDGVIQHLTGENVVTDLGRFTDRSHGLSFLILKNFICCKNGLTNPAGQLSLGPEEFIIIAEPLRRALLGLRNMVENGSFIIPEYAVGKPCYFTSYWVYRFRPILAVLANSCSEDQRQHVNQFVQYFTDGKKSEYDEVDRLLSKGTIKQELLGYLFVPGDVLMVKSPNGPEFNVGSQLLEWSVLRWHHKSAEDRSSSRVEFKTRLKLMAWVFDGNFMSREETFDASLDFDATAETEIVNLPIFPIRLCPKTVQQKYLKRGKMFWDCRKMKYVSYSGWDTDIFEIYDNSRFMIDHQACQRLIRTDFGKLDEPRRPYEDHLGPRVIDTSTPPSEDFLFMTPATLIGFHMETKSWKQLVVSRMQEVDWDLGAFSSLVIPNDTKDVIKSLVTKRVGASSFTDLIRGRANGLIILLHGPPGTGKTLTAESVAESARKPLYRVTCGDIGLEPTSVEKYLVGILELGKKWDCVVLLDEADVFLQERTLTNLQRNALVSVFLRVLESYDGILILTSNRVATFDEGFKSRIQLALHFPKLSKTSRRKVWENFINRLEEDALSLKDIDIDDLRDNLNELSEFDLNGREIRNAINVARPVASSEDRKLDFKCLRKVIKVQGRFDEYIKEVNEGHDDEEVAREIGKR